MANIAWIRKFAKGRRKLKLQTKRTPENLKCTTGEGMEGVLLFVSILEFSEFASKIAWQN